MTEEAAPKPKAESKMPEPVRYPVVYEGVSYVVLAEETGCTPSAIARRFVEQFQPNLLVESLQFRAGNRVLTDGGSVEGQLKEIRAKGNPDAYVEIVVDPVLLTRAKERSAAAGATIKLAQALDGAWFVHVPEPASAKAEAIIGLAGKKARRGRIWRSYYVGFAAGSPVWLNRKEIAARVGEKP